MPEVGGAKVGASQLTQVITIHNKNLKRKICWTLIWNKGSRMQKRNVGEKPATRCESHPGFSVNFCMSNPLSSFPRTRSTCKAGGSSEETLT